MASGRPGWGMVMHGHWWTPGGNGMKPAWKFLAVGLLAALLLSAAYGAAVIQSRGVTPPPHDFPSFLSTNALAVTVVLASAAFVLFILQRSGSPLPGWLGLWTFAFVAFLVYLVAGRVGADGPPVVGRRGRRGVVGHGPGAGLDGRRDRAARRGSREGAARGGLRVAAGAIARVAGLVPARAGRADDAGRPRGRGPAGRDRPIRPRFAQRPALPRGVRRDRPVRPLAPPADPARRAEPGGVPRSAPGEEPAQHVDRARHPTRRTSRRSRRSTPLRLRAAGRRVLQRPVQAVDGRARARAEATTHDSMYFDRSHPGRAVRAKRPAGVGLPGRIAAADAEPAR